MKQIPQGTVQELLVKNNHSAPGFDAIRLCLATLILFWHSFYVCYPEHSLSFYQSWSNPFSHPFLKMILPMFFFLSGFLVSTSAYRLRSTWVFLLYRAFRIFPALMVEVVISAVFIGSLVTTLPLAQYFSDPVFFRYFLNIIGKVQFLLPGVFKEHPCEIVNSNLWTLPAEFYCYLGMSGLLLTRILFHRKWLFRVFILATSVLFYLLYTRLTWGDTGVVFVRPLVLIYCFFVGVVCFAYSDRLILSQKYFWISIAGLAFFDCKYTTMLGVFSCCYLCLSIGFMNLRKFPLIRYGDFSYGIYLYGFPIEQTIWHFLPVAHTWWVLISMAFPITLGFSIFSWKIIEQPFLELKRHIVKRKHKIDLEDGATREEIEDATWKTFEPGTEV